MHCSLPKRTTTKRMTKLFFSGTLSDNSPLQRFCDLNGWQLTARSLLEFETIPFAVTVPYDVVFFSSPRSVNYFISQQRVPDNVQLACIGAGTAAALAKHNLTPAFVGVKSGDPEKVAQDFKAWLGERHVLFPLAKQSNETIAKVIPDQQKSIVRCYETRFVQQRIPAQDFYVFTSPSNVKAFLEVNALPPDAKAIAWGNTTNCKLVELEIKSFFVLEESSEEALVKVLAGLL